MTNLDFIYAKLRGRRGALLPAFELPKLRDSVFARAGRLSGLALSRRAGADERSPRGASVRPS